MSERVKRAETFQWTLTLVAMRTIPAMRSQRMKETAARVLTTPLIPKTASLKMATCRTPKWVRSLFQSNRIFLNAHKFSQTLQWATWAERRKSILVLLLWRWRGLFIVKSVAGTVSEHVCSKSHHSACLNFATIFCRRRSMSSAIFFCSNSKVFFFGKTR